MQYPGFFAWTLYSETLKKKQKAAPGMGLQAILA